MTETLKAPACAPVSLGAWTLLSLLLSRAGEPSLRRTLAVLVALLLPPPLNAYVTLVRGSAWTPLALWSHCLTWAYGPPALRQPGAGPFLAERGMGPRLAFAADGLALAAGAAGLDWVSWPPLVFSAGAADARLRCLGGPRCVARTGAAAPARQRAPQQQPCALAAVPRRRFGGGQRLGPGVFAAIEFGRWPPSHFAAAASSLGMAVHVDAIALLALHPPAWLDGEPAPACASASA